MGFFRWLFGKGSQSSKRRDIRPEITVDYINFLQITSSPRLFWQVHSALENHLVNYRDYDFAGHSFSDFSQEKKEKKFWEILNSFIDQKFHGGYIIDLYSSLNELTLDEVEAESYNLWHAERSLEMLKFQLSYNWTVNEDCKNGKTPYEHSPFHEKYGPFKNSKISTENLHLFLSRYNDLKGKLKEFKTQFGLPIYENEWPFFLNKNEPLTYKWRLGAIPIIPKHKHMPLGHLSGFTSHDYSSEGFSMMHDLNQLKIELNEFSDYVFLAKHGKDFGFYSLFNPPSGSDLTDDYKKLVSFELSLLEIEKSSFFIENRSLIEIKKIAQEIKEKINEQKRTEQEESFRLAQQKAEEAAKKMKLEKWKEIKKLVKCEITNKINKHLAGIYVIHCEVNNGIYIGSTENFYKRRLQHLHGLRNLSHHSYKLQNSFNDFEEGSLRFYVLLTINAEDNSFKNKRKLKLIEQDFLGQYEPDLNIERDAFGKRHYYF